MHLQKETTKTTKRHVCVLQKNIVTLCYLVNSLTKPGFLLFITMTFDQRKILEGLHVAYVSMPFSLVVKPNTNVIIWFLVTIMSQTVLRSQTSQQGFCRGDVGKSERKNKTENSSNGNGFQGQCVKWRIKEKVVSRDFSMH